MYKFLVIGVLLVLQLGISKGNPLVAGYNDQNGPRTYRSRRDTMEYDIPGRYELHRIDANWSRARQICINLGGNLTVIRSIFDELMVKNVLQSNEVPFVWLGFHEVSQPGDDLHWETGIDGDSVNLRTVNAWKHNIPMDKTILYGPERHNIEECGLFAWKVGVIPAPCAIPAPFICDYKLD